MEDTRLQMMMLDIDGVLTRHHADTTDVLAAAQVLATSAIGHLVNAAIKREQDDARISHAEREQGRAERLNVGKSSGTGSADSSEATASGDQVPVPSDSHPLADAIAEQIRAALHKRIEEGPKPDW